ncbi:unnamed protein product [Closterium sp. NIES-53]
MSIKSSSSVESDEKFPGSRHLSISDVGLKEEPASRRKSKETKEIKDTSRGETEEQDENDIADDFVALSARRTTPRGRVKTPEKGRLATSDQENGGQDASGQQGSQGDGAENAEDKMAGLAADVAASEGASAAEEESDAVSDFPEASEEEVARAKPVVLASPPPQPKPPPKKPPRPPPNPNDYLLKFKPITPTPPKTWPDNIILTLATGEASKNLTVLLQSFKRFVEHGGRAWLILFFDRVPLWWWPMTAEQRKGIYMQQYEAPRAGNWSHAPATNIRYLVFKKFLHELGSSFEGNVALSDAHDILFLRDPFPAKESKDMFLRFITEASQYPRHGTKALSLQHKQLLSCFSRKEAFSLGGMRVINPGFIYGPASHMRQLLTLIVAIFQQGPRVCMRWETSDQAVINQLVRAGMLKSMPQIKVQDMERASVLHRFGPDDKYIIGDHKKLLNEHGGTLSVLHGFDRFPDTRVLASRVLSGKL